MKTKEQVTAEFRAKLKALLGEYKATLAIEDLSGPNSFFPDDQMVVTIKATWDNDNNLTQEYTEINLGSYVDWE